MTITNSILNKKIDKLEEKIDEINEKLSKNSEILFQHHSDLYGNGKKGLIMQVEDLKEVQNKHSKYFWLLSIVCTGCGYIFTFIINKLGK